MGARSADALLGLPVGLHGIRLGRPVDLLVDPGEWRVLGFDVLCGDGASRFLAWATTTIGDDELTVGSALMLLEDVDFYRTRARSFRALRGIETAAGPLTDLLLADDGTVAAVATDGGHVRPDEVELSPPAETTTGGW